MGRSIGVDLHKTSFTVCFYTAEEAYTFKTYRMSRMGLAAFRKHLQPDDELAVESTGNTAFFVREIQAAVKRVRIVNPVQFKVIANSVKKTDRIDALTIARFLRRDLIPEVRMRSQEESQRSSLIGTRDKFVKLRTVLKNKLHSILHANGIMSKPEMFTSEKGLKTLLTVPLEGSYRFEVGWLVTEIRHLNEAVKQLDEELKRQGQSLPGYQNLTSIKGISDTGATIFLTAIGNIADFKDEKALASYFGIVPRVYQSNQTLRYGRITKQGNKIARTALVQSTLVAIKYSPYLRAFYEQVKGRRGSGKAIIATARKLLGIIYNTLKHHWVFEDFTTFKLATSS
jgi:transposase